MGRALPVTAYDVVRGRKWVNKKHSFLLPLLSRHLSTSITTPPPITSRQCPISPRESILGNKLESVLLLFYTVSFVQFCSLSSSNIGPHWVANSPVNQLSIEHKLSTSQPWINYLSIGCSPNIIHPSVNRQSTISQLPIDHQLTIDWFKRKKKKKRFLCFAVLFFLCS